MSAEHIETLIASLIENGGVAEIKKDGAMKIKLNGANASGSSSAERMRRLRERRKADVTPVTPVTDVTDVTQCDISDASDASDAVTDVTHVTDVTDVTPFEEPEEFLSLEGNILILAREKATRWKLPESTADRWLAELNGDIPQEWGKAFASWVSRQSLRSA